MQQFRRLTAMIAVGVVLAGCTVTESSRSGGLVPPRGTVPAAVTTPATVVTVAATDRSRGTVAFPSTSALATGSPLTSTGSPLTSTGSPLTSTSEPASTGAVPASTEDDGLSEAQMVLATAEPIEGFREGVLSVSGPAGTRLWPVIIADTDPARQRGLMGVSDFATLGGYAAMVFVFSEDTAGAFWMRDTPLPLRITFVAADGSVVSGTDMAPCLAPTPADECDRYFAEGPYRLAVEHPLGPDFDLGLAGAGLVEVSVQ